MLEKKSKGQSEKNGKGKFQKKPRKIVFLGGCEEMVFLLKCHFLEKLANTIRVQTVKKKHPFRWQLSVLEMVLFCGHSKWQTL